MKESKEKDTSWGEYVLAFFMIIIFSVGLLFTGFKLLEGICYVSEKLSSVNFMEHRLDLLEYNQNQLPEHYEELAERMSDYKDDISYRMEKIDHKKSVLTKIKPRNCSMDIINGGVLCE